jgi:hypothetical protein
MVWAVSLSTLDLITQRLPPEITVTGIRSLIGFGTLVGALAHSVLYLRYGMSRGDTSISFGENQLSPALIGLSPLPTAHPKSFQPQRVRTSTRFYPRFILAIGRSTGFGSIACDYTPYSDSLSLRLHLNRLNLAADSDSPTHDAKGTKSGIVFPKKHHSPSTACRHRVSGTLSLPSPGCFSPFPHGTIRYRSLADI